MHWFEYMLEEYSKLLRWCCKRREYVLPKGVEGIVCKACITERQKIQRLNPIAPDICFCKKGFTWNKHLQRHTSQEELKRSEEGWESLKADLRIMFEDQGRGEEFDKWIKENERQRFNGLVCNH